MDNLKNIEIIYNFSKHWFLCNFFEIKMSVKLLLKYATHSFLDA